jgi:hypothetical protein
VSCASSAPNLVQKGDILKITIDNQQVTDGGRVLLNPASATTRVEVQKDFNSFFVQHTQPQQKHFYRLVPQIYT